MAENKENIIEVRDLSCRYEGKPLLHGIDFELKQGEILCLLGPSGAGKTTLLRLLAGLETGYRGEILCQGADLRGMPPHRRNFGMMFQEYALFPHKDVLHNVAFGLEIKHQSTALQRQVVARMLDIVGLAGFENRRVDELSGGERQRVALARSLAPSPRLLLLDEPLGSLDRELRERLAIEIRAILKDCGVTSVFVTHDQTEAFSIADRIAILQDGHLEQLGTPEEIYRQPVNRKVARFLGFSNIFSGRIDKDGVFSCQGFALSLKPAGNWPAGPCELLIRPDGARLLHDAAGRQPAVTGRVKGSRFLGGSYRVVVDMGGSELSVDLPLDPAPPVVGEKIHLAISRSSVVGLEKE